LSKVPHTVSTGSESPVSSRGSSFGALEFGDPGPVEGLFLQPEAFIVDAGRRSDPAPALPLAGGPIAFAAVRALRRHAGGLAERLLPVASLRTWAAREGLAAETEAVLDRLVRPRPAFAGLALDRPRIMGIVNVTPDSFSDGGDAWGAAAAIAHGRALAAAGADILDIGGESTRPGSHPVAEAEEIRRVVPVVEALAAEGAIVSVDTRRAGVMRAAIAAGARIVNDVTALAGDPAALAAVARTDASVVLMHMRGEPRTMQQAPVYVHAPTDVYAWLAARVEACEAAGIAPGRIAVDPGFGFGKTTRHNLELVRDLALFHGMGCAILLGVSRKSTIGRIAGVDDPKARGPGSLALGLAGLDRGARILRVHDVAETRQAMALWSALRAGSAPPPA